MNFISNKKTIIASLAIIAGLLGALFLLPGSSVPFLSQAKAQTQSPSGENGPPPKDRESKPATQKLLVTVVDVKPETQQPLVTGFGEVEARWTTELTAEVSGQVDYVSDKLLSGSHFNKGDVLVKINAVDYESEVATAEADVAAANVVYLEQQQETRQAKERWELSGLSGTPSNLTLQTPQLSEALASLNSAKAALAKAKKDLARTKIVAPFNGRVSERNIDLGGYVSTGSSIATLFSTDVMDVNVALNEKQFALIGDEPQAVNKSVNLTNTADKQGQWTGRIARFQYHVDSTERTRNLVLTLNAEDNENALLPGTFVKAVIPGKNLDTLIKLPASALSPDGYIWYVKDEVLARFTANLVYQVDDYLVVKAPEMSSTLQVVRHPQMAFLPGQAVHAQTVAGQPSDPVSAAKSLLPKAGADS